MANNNNDILSFFTANDEIKYLLQKNILNPIVDKAYNRWKPYLMSLLIMYFIIICLLLVNTLLLLNKKKLS